MRVAIEGEQGPDAFGGETDRESGERGVLVVHA